MEDNFKVGYRSEEKIFEVIFHDLITKETVYKCRQAQLECFENNYDGGEYKFLLDTRGYKPESEEVHRLIRTVICNKDNIEISSKCVAAAAVNDNVSTISHKRLNYNKHGEEFFYDIDEALEWLSKF